ncbi:MAG: DEAD/DEAH box helicase family protein [Neisseriaceae bacterium]|nr:DEAD/DEAH box helicase family protein [Neisseriaceae bacterium]
MTLEEAARIKIDKQLTNAGWNIVSRDEYVAGSTSAVKEALMQGNTESDYLLFIDDKAIAVIEAKRKENSLGAEVRQQAEDYARAPQNWYGVWFPNLIPLVYIANGEKIYFKNTLKPNTDYEEIPTIHTPKKMLQLISKQSDFGCLPLLDKRHLRDCQYETAIKFEESLKAGKKKSLAVLATGSGKTYLACLASYRLLNYTPVKKILFLVDRNNLARQTESEFNTFDLTENQQEMSSLYEIKRLKKDNDIKADIVISTIQKLFAVLTGNPLIDSDSEDFEDEQNTADNDKEDGQIIELGNDLKLPPDYFQLIIIDECHRSIYGKWKAVLDYFSKAYILGLTATPTDQALAFFNINQIQNYDYEDSVNDGANVPNRVFRIATQVSEEGGTIERGDTITEITRRTGEETTRTTNAPAPYSKGELDRSVTNIEQIKLVLSTYKNAIYEVLYPEREKNWAYIPKTLIFAKDENHATQIVEIAKQVFAEEFENGELPQHFIQKITYTAENSDQLIREFRTAKDFRIAVTVTLVATGTDIKPLEVVFFMKDIHSSTLYTQMKGRGCRVINDDKLREVTPNANSKEYYYIVDAVGVTKSEKRTPTIDPRKAKKILTLEALLEHLSHGELSDENLQLLSHYCSTIHNRYKNNTLFAHHLNSFEKAYSISLIELARNIHQALESDTLSPYISPSDNNAQRKNLIAELISNIAARKKLIEMKKGYHVQTQGLDNLIYAGFSEEEARTFIQNFEQYIEEHKDEIEALRIIYNSQDIVITYSMLIDLRDRLLAENRQYTAEYIWKNYKALDKSVDELDTKANAARLTELIQIMRYAYKKTPKLTSIIKGYARGLNLYFGQTQRSFNEEQQAIMREIAEYIINNGAITAQELHDTIDTNLWKDAITAKITDFDAEIKTMSQFLLKAA